ncbi:MULTISPECIES: GNAT family N-acetyltransferase [unclassified Motilimonas]|uniref:GNAT family N-acetyltransferase n=1 Tax=Motilimonas TaxID=1914248 RepID=UPI001E34E1B7|nr:MULTISPECIES: GNAT family N-acetyltransferase [unclassified Motilimonas]MCE0559363.1 GNAT family N-acetyltransferase [Motilimonas sp. E26]MDO6528124.1 GNAT family N-acetyltransferase [Motilimonas sp. 1_MG-2023]
MSLSLSFEDASLFSPVAQLLLNELDSEASNSQSVLDDFLLGDYQLLIARSNGDAIGCTLYRLDGLNELDIRCLYVRSGYREQGVGKSLLKQLTAQVQLTTDKVLVIRSQHLMVESLILSLGLRSNSAPRSYPSHLKASLSPTPKVGNLHIL